MNNRDKTVYGSDLYTYGIDHMELCETRYLQDETMYFVKEIK